MMNLSCAILGNGHFSSCHMHYHPHALACCGLPPTFSRFSRGDIHDSRCQQHATLTIRAIAGRSTLAHGPCPDVQGPCMLKDPIESPSDRDSKATSVGESKPLTLTDDQRWLAVKKKLGTIISNAQRHSQGLHQIKHSLGVDLGDSRTGVAISLKGYAPRPLTVLHMKGDKLFENLVQIALKERADEFIVGLPTSFDGKENIQSNKTRSFAGRLATQAAQRGWRVYLVDEYGSSQDGLGYMLEIGVKKRSRKDMSDAYAALVFLHSYFDSEGARAKLVVPKGLSCQERLCLGDKSTIDEFDEYY